MPNSNKFLENVAEYLLGDTHDHRDTLLVFPNKRSIIYMRRYMKRLSRGVSFMPRMKTLGSFLASFSDKEEASRIEQIFTLYDAYCEVCDSLGQTVMPFDRFRFWGEILLDDFEDIDRQNIDAEALFTNLKRLHEIQTDFLDEEQRKVAKEIWGYDPGDAYEGFKKRLAEKNEDDAVYNNFLRLTEMLHPVYEAFFRMLAREGLTTRGRILRDALVAIENGVELPARIALIGFGIPSNSERKIFKELRKGTLTEFFWDIPEMLTRDLPEGMEGYGSPLKKYIDNLVRDFPMPDAYVQPFVSEGPEIDIISVPSGTRQTKICGNILNRLEAEGQLNPTRADNTVIVLPNPSLLISLLHTVRVSPVNVTMGLPIRHTPFATLLRLIIKLNMSAHTDRDGDTVFLTQNVVSILSHPSLTVLLPNETSTLRNLLETKGRFTTKLKTIIEKAPALAFVFKPIDKDSTLSDAREFIESIIDGMTTLIGDVTGEDVDKAALHEYRVLTALRGAVDNLVGVIDRHPRVEESQNVGAFTFIRMIEGQLFREQLNFSGSPLVGVQIMGALETRSLDFDNVIMLSLNEKTFPPRNFMKSMLPLSLRGVFDMTMPETKELEYAWIYANLVSRSRKVFLMYDTSGEALGNGGISRYLFQTRYIYNRPKIRQININPTGRTTENHDIEIAKTPEVMAELERFKAGGASGLSVSSLEAFASCPLRFYLSKVKRIKEPKRISEAIDALAIGNAVHHTMERIFEKVRELRNSRMDEDFEISDETIRRIFVEELSSEWYSGDYSTYSELPPQGQIQTDVWSRKISDIVRLERTRPSGAYTFVQNEMKPSELTGERYFDWPINENLTVRFTFAIDRVDLLDDGSYRFIDYKTGSDTRTVGSLDLLFWGPKENANETAPNKVIFQLLTYAHAFEELMRQQGKSVDRGIILQLVQVATPDDSIDKPLRISRTDLITHRDESVKDFLPRLKELIARIFDSEEPFKQTPYESECLYCQFKNICQRNPEKKF